MELPRSFLFVTFEGGGNVPPVLGLARRLVERGHRVRVLAEPCLRGTVEAIGAAFVPFTEHFTRTDRTEVLIRDWEAKSPPGAIKRTLRDVVLGPAEVVARHTEAALDAENTGALVVDWLMPGAIAVGEARGVPTAVLHHCINMLPGPGKPASGFAPARGPLGRLRDRVVQGLMHRTADAWLPLLNELRQRRGLDPLDHVFDAYLCADRFLVQTCEAFDFPIVPAPENLRYVGPTLDAPDWIEGETWTSPWAADDPRPLIVVSLSSTFQNQQRTLQQAITALGMLNVRGLVTLGPAMRTESFDVPENVVVVEAAPHGQVFPHADAFVTHGGHGSVMKALAHGVPLVALPMGRDQDDTAVRIVERGLGLRPKRKPGAIAEAVRRVLAEPPFRAAARRMAATIRKDVAADRSISELEALAERNRVPEQVPA
jgi:MGT family glycosyltransferase